MWEDRSHWSPSSLESMPKLNKERHFTFALFFSHFLQHNPRKSH